MDKRCLWMDKGGRHSVAFLLRCQGIAINNAHLNCSAQKEGGAFRRFLPSNISTACKASETTCTLPKEFYKNKIKYCSFLNMRRVLAAGHPKHHLCRFQKRGSKRKKPLHHHQQTSEVSHGQKPTEVICFAGKKYHQKTTHF